MHICSQPPEQALRRPACFMPQQAEEYLALLKPYARKLDQKEQVQFRWRQRRYWGLMLLHRLLPGLIAKPDKALLDFYYKRAERAHNA